LVDRHLRDLRGSRTLPGFDAIRLPGEERRQQRNPGTAGVLVDEAGFVP
jgi:LDH2 family malate/lactate/ureidoglycolate dehydrogenase